MISKTILRMKKLPLIKIIIYVVVVLNMGCGTNFKEKGILLKEIENTKRSFAPDKRTALFDIVVLTGPSSITLAGESNLPDAVASLKSRLTANGIDFIDKIKILPSPELEGKREAVITISAANLRSNPKHSAELATQATLGTIVNVLKKEDSWYLIQTPDAYLAWVDAGGIALMDERNIEEWKESKKLIYTDTYGHAYDSVNSNKRVSDLVAGSILRLLGADGEYFSVQFPDGRRGVVPKKEAQEYHLWLSNLTTDADALVETSKTLMGVPYLWGGTSTKGVDCSGFTKTIYFLNGMVLPRDASQQVHTGKQIDSVANFDVLEKGDLLFFGRKSTIDSPEKVVHVGMWIGNNRFIHASDRVRISSVNKNDENYDAYNVGRYLRSKRILKQDDARIIDLKKTKQIKG